MTENDYYKILQVDPEAEQEVIESAYKRLASKYHPDHCQDSDAVERMKLINDAYDTLRDPAKRASYDQSRIERPPSFFYEYLSQQHSHKNKWGNRTLSLIKLAATITILVVIAISGYYAVEKAREVTDLVDENIEQSGWDQVNLSPTEKASDESAEQFKTLIYNPIPSSPPGFTPSPTSKAVEPELSVSNLVVSPKTVSLGEPVSVTVTLKSSSDRFSSLTITLRTNYGASETRHVPLSPGETRPVTFKLIKNTVGTYQVDVEGLKGSFTVQNNP